MGFCVDRVDPSMLEGVVVVVRLENILSRILSEKGWWCD
jgi:hypothetical protein